MTTQTMSLRVSGRAIAAAAIEGEQLAVRDVRYLPSTADAAVRAARRFVRQAVEPMRPKVVLIDAPGEAGSHASMVLEGVREALAAASAEVRVVPQGDVLFSFGVPGLRTRAELRAVSESIWPELKAVSSKGRPFLAEAAALALYGEAREALAAEAPT